MKYTDQDRRDIVFIAKEICENHYPIFDDNEKNARYYFWDSLNEDVNKRLARNLMALCPPILPANPMNVYKIEI